MSISWRLPTSVCALPLATRTNNKDLAVFDSQDAQQVWNTVQALNRTWTVDQDADRLVEYFAPDMVAITPTDRLRREGADACVAGWREFTQSVRITDWREEDPKIQLLADGKVAIVTYYYQMAFEAGGRSVELGGRDMLVLEKREGRWWVVADQFSSFPNA